jgi:hypothetical protein
MTIQEGLREFREVRAETMRMAAPLTQPQADKSAGPSAWSPGEVVDHLLLSEALYRGVFRELIDLDRAGKRPVVYRGFDQIDTSIMGIPRPILPLLTMPLLMFNFFVPQPVREAFTRYRILPAQNPRIATPRKSRNVETLRTELAESIGQTATLLEANPNARYDTMRFCHPLMGNNDVPGLFRLLTRHEQRHQTQLAEAIRSAGA